MLRLMLLVPVLLLGLVACGGTGQPPRPTPTTSAVAPPMATSTAPAKPTLDTLVTDPCNALTADDTSRLDVFVAGAPLPYDKQTCSWGAKGALVQFTPYPKEDKTKGENVRKIPASTIAGHRAKLGQLTHGGDTAYTVFVAVGSGSFRLLAVSFGEGTPGPDPLTVAKNFATAILKRLG